MVIAESDEEAQKLWRDSGAFCGAAWFEPFGFSRGLLDPDTDEPPGDLFAEGLALVGTVDTVSRQLEHLRARLPVEWLFVWAYNGLIPHPRMLSLIEDFKEIVLPRVCEPQPDDAT